MDITDAVGISGEHKKAVEKLSALIDNISSVWGAVNTAKNALAALGVLSGSDQLAEVRKQIDQLTADFHKAIAGLEKELTMRDTANQLALARRALDDVTEFAPENNAWILGVNPRWDAVWDDVVENSGLAEIRLGSPSFWQRLYLPELEYHFRFAATRSGPSPDFVPIAQGLVFDYRLALPAYLEAVTVRLTVLVAAVQDYRHIAHDELRRIITTLEARFNQIRAAIVEVMWCPSNINDSQDTYSGGYPGVPLWIRSGALVGVVEYYSGLEHVNGWPSHEFPLVNFPGTDEHWRQFLARFALRNWVRWKQLYSIVGLPKVEGIIAKLKEMAGIEPARITGPGVDYAVRELAKKMHDMNKTQWGGGTILDDGRGELVKVISLREVFGLLQTASLREVLAL